MRYFLAICITLFSCCYADCVKGQTTSNEGFDFWAVFPTHIPTSSSTLAKMSIYITSQNNSAGTVSIGDNTISFRVMANQIVEIPISYDQAYISANLSNTVIKNKSIHILVDQGSPKVAVFAFISASARSEAYLILPKEAMGQEYYAMGHEGNPAPSAEENGSVGEHYLIVTATEPNTNIIITKPDKSVITQFLPDVGDLFQLTDDQDFSGTKIQSTGCTKFAAYSGHSGIAYDLQTPQRSSFDPLVQQLYPTQSWGRNYGLIPFINRNYFYKVLAAEEGTEIKVNGITEAVLNAGEWYVPEHLPLSAPMLLTSNKPVSVAQFAYSQEHLNAIPETISFGDPDMVILNAEEYNIKKITLFASFDRTTEFYLNVFMKTSGRESFKVNGAVPNGIWKQLPSDPQYSYIQITFNQYTLKQSSLALTAEEGFNAMAYGFGDFESYAYSAGTNLTVTNYLRLTNLNAGVTDVNACINEPLAVKVVLPARAKRLAWRFEDPAWNYLDNNPQGRSFVNEDGITQFEYQYSNGIVSYNTLGFHEIMVTADLEPGVDPCPENVGRRVYTYNFEITVPQVSVPDTVEVLAGGTATINGSSNFGNLTYRWSPAFGLSDASILNPIVTAENTTAYTITAYSDLGCSVSETVIVKVVDSFNIPNTFSPNGDGINDLWNLKLLNTYENSLVEIFNRYGQVVYSIVGYRIPFDGYFEGKQLPVGTYYYVIAPGNGKKNITGALTIIR